ncbi:PIG-L family deacetylase [Pelagicoccus sp. NFK12]|uniref:PIG-L family deacetylase n=1 Tax=Pelagicoccus enzymogenes TaxID=2773457 RepID=A0A927FAL4_9BACT|nr:PIG-L deacetylase family protein [Pelagicoccus enzymogenes]MBD5781447.1 PIG-L family deacetylase [Pelagicoccus enzymogenes]
MNSVLIVVAHPDDETLGCGATAAALSAKGIPVRSCILSGNAAARKGHPGQSELIDDTHKAHDILGMPAPIWGDFPNIKLNTVPHLDLVQFIEAAIEETQADTIFTHHPSDLNNDHLHVSRACQAAARLCQRRPNVPQLTALHFMEILSSTDWSFPTAAPAFFANSYFPVSGFLDKKIAAMKAYRGVMRPYPHPRSEEAIKAQAALRGAESGLGPCEAFQTVFSVIS